jgi:hypothetical protein
MRSLAHPFDCYGDMTFDGKLGIWLFIYEEAEKRKSKNRDGENHVN